jgi:hypothetical protein
MIVVVYHAYLFNNWEILVKQQLDRLVKSGLYDKADQIWMTINLSENVSEESAKLFLFQYSKIQLEFYQQNHAEYPGIKKVKEISDKYDNAKILYFHTKGISNNWLTFDSKRLSSEKITNVAAWRECLEYFLIDKWKECIEKLDEYDNVGVSCNGGWYWGNFWWSQSKHIKKTKPVGIWGRWDYEAWLNADIPESKNYEFYHMNFNPFLTTLYPEFYREQFNRYSGKKIKLKNAVYGTPPFEIDEGYSTVPLNITKDITTIIQKILDDNNQLKIFINVNNETMGGDPIWGHRKCMILTIYPDGYPNKIFKLGVTEGSSIDFSF